jgi:hypothetical protein
LVPDRFWGGIIGTFLAALAGGVATGFLLPLPRSDRESARDRRSDLGHARLGRWTGRLQAYGVWRSRTTSDREG